MKKGVILQLLLIIIMASLSYAAEQVGNLATVTGKVQVTHEGEKTAIAVQGGSRVYFKDRITTAASSNAKILFKDDSVLSLSQKAEIVINQAIFDPAEKTRSSVFGLVKGSLRSIVGKHTGAFEVHTENTVSSARGTHFIVQILENGQVLIVCLEGNVVVHNPFNPSQTGTLTANQFTTVTGTLPPTLPSQMSPPALQQLIMETTAAYQPKERVNAPQGPIYFSDPIPSRGVYQFHNKAGFNTGGNNNGAGSSTGTPTEGTPSSNNSTNVILVIPTR
ncbi:MAG: FecR family protein [Nitrospirota bacterium]